MVEYMQDELFNWVSAAFPILSQHATLRNHPRVLTEHFNFSTTLGLDQGHVHPSAVIGHSNTLLGQLL